MVNFLFLGRLDGDKNVATLVRAMPFVHKNVFLTIVGKGKNKASLHKLTHHLTVKDKIKWIDYVNDQEILKIYHNADCFVIMSPYEGQSIVTLQAVASSLPIIAANAGALPELVKDNINGYLVSTYDYKTLAVKMNKLASNKKLRDKFGHESRKISLDHNKKKVLHKLELLYQKLAS